jgi:uncharacterized membrane protein YtjA (UPF0391 family)
MGIILPRKHMIMLKVCFEIELKPCFFIRVAFGTYLVKRFSSFIKNLNHLSIMLRWTVIFLIVAIIAGVLGFGGIAAGAAGIAKILFFVFLVLFVLSLISRGVGRS